MKDNKLYGQYETQQEIDAVYDVEKAVPDFEACIKDFQQGSEKVRNVFGNRHSLSYGATRMETLTVYPSASEKAPVLLFIHGGYWKMGIGDDYDFVASGPLEAGYTVVIVTYAIAPKVNIPEMVRQVRSSIAWTFKNISAYNGNPDQLYIAGHSAGAHLAAMALGTCWDDYAVPVDVIKGMLLISGLYDLEPVSQTFVQPALRISGEQVLYYSPLRLASLGTVPLVISWGDQETSAFKDQSTAYLNVMKDAGNSCTGLIIPEKNHFNILNGFKMENGTLTAAISSLLNNKPAINHYD